MLVVKSAVARAPKIENEIENNIVISADNFEVNDKRVKFTKIVKENGDEIEYIVGYFLLDKIIGFIKI